MGLALGDGGEPAPAALVRAHIARALAPEVEPPATPGRMVLLPHQREAVGLLRDALARHGGALLADPVGTGKTYVALAIAGAYPRTLVVAPATLRAMWQRALTATTTRADFVSLESLSRRRPTAAAGGGLVIVDEAHHARNPGTRRYDALAELTWGNHVLLLSATPVHNRARDLHALCALFLGDAASRVPADTLARVLCRRLDAAPRGALPRLAPLRWVDIGGDASVPAALLDLPPPLPPRGAGAANALGTFVLVRQWCSSHAALLAALDRRLTAAAAMESRLAQGGHLTRRELGEWVVDAGVVQLGLPFPDREPPVAGGDSMLARLRSHSAAVRALRGRLLAQGLPDARRLGRLVEIVDRHHPTRVVMFTHSFDTAVACWRALAPRVRCAVLGGGVSRIASGRVPRDDVVRRFAPGGPPRGRDDAATRLDVLIATDVLSEGVDLHDAGVLVHLDLPWTVARLEQRAGRLRRLGATHAEIVQYVLRPPPLAEATIGVLRRLAMKAGIARRRLGIDPLGFTLPHSPAHRRRHEGESVSDAAERVRRLTRRWLDDRVGRRDDPGAPCLFAATSADTEGFLAVVADGSALRVVAGVGSSVTADPSEVAALAACGGGDDVVAPAAQIRIAHARLGAWCEAERARLSLHLDATSRVHRRVVRRLGGAGPGLPRSIRRAMVLEVERLRDVLARSIGAGAERHLERWLRDRGATRPTIDDLRSLREELEPRARSRRDDSGEPRVRALLLLVPARHPSGGSRPPGR